MRQRWWYETRLPRQLLQQRVHGLQKIPGLHLIYDVSSLALSLSVLIVANILADLRPSLRQTAVASGSGKHCLARVTCGGMRFVIAKGVFAETVDCRMTSNDVSLAKTDGGGGGCCADGGGGCVAKYGGLVLVETGAVFIGKGTEFDRGKAW